MKSAVCYFKISWNFLICRVPARLISKFMAGCFQRHVMTFMQLKNKFLGENFFQFDDLEAERSNLIRKMRSF